MYHRCMAEVHPPPTGGGGPVTADFHRRVLDHVDAAVFVVDAEARLSYANDAVLAIGDWRHEELIGAHVLDHVHPDDRDWVSEAFLNLVGPNRDIELGRGVPWAPIHLRLVRSDGRAVPVEVIGHDGLDDPDIGGIVYDVRVATAHEMLGRVLRGIADGCEVEHLLALVLEIMVEAPMVLDAAILETGEMGRFRVAASTSARFASLVSSADVSPWSAPAERVRHVPIDEMTAPVGRSLADAGYVDLWHVAVESALGLTAYRIVACSPYRQSSTAGIVDRIERARELAGVVLLRSQTDDVLAHAVAHDPLTRLPNRIGFRDGMVALRRDPDPTIVLYVDLDGFKQINDRHGHHAGDRVLEVVADRLRAATRPSDLVARLGGDEFAIVLRADPTSRAEEQGAAMARRVVELIGQAIELDDDTLVGVAASVGIVVSEASASIDEVLADADAAMYVAKRAGGGRHVVGRSLTAGP